MVIRRLNMDNSWWIQWNYIRFLIDPWLCGTEVDYFSWFNTQWHKSAPMSVDEIPTFDVVIITQKYPDHFHPETLQKIKPTFILGPPSIAVSCKKHLPQAHFEPLQSKPSALDVAGCTIHVIKSSMLAGPDFQAIILDNGTESIWIAPHSLPDRAKLEKTVRLTSPATLLLAPFNSYRLPWLLGGTISPGVDRVQQAMQVINPKYVVATHDEDKAAKGLVPRLAKTVASPSADQLKKVEVFEKSYLHIDHYEPVVLSQF